VDQRGDEEGPRQHAGLGDLIVIELLQTDGGAGGGEGRPRKKHRPGQDTFGDVHG